MRRNIKVMITALTLSAVCAVCTYGGSWNQDETGYWYDYGGGDCAKSGIKTIDGTNYAFDENGYMLTGWQYINFRWYYFAPDGAQAKGWIQLDGNWYYLDPNNDGAMYTYWLDLGKDRYYFNEKGVMQTGVFYLSDSTTGSRYAYQTDETGALIRNTTKRNGSKTIKYDMDGVMMYRNETTENVDKATGDGKWQYVLNERDMQEQKVENQETLLSGALNLRMELYDDYQEKVASRRSSKAREEQTAIWEKKVRKKLDGFMTAEEIELYIKKVEEGTYVREVRQGYEGSVSDEGYDYGTNKYEDYDEGDSGSDTYDYEDSYDYD